MKVTTGQSNNEIANRILFILVVFCFLPCNIFVFFSSRLFIIEKNHPSTMCTSAAAKAALRKICTHTWERESPRGV